MPEFYTRTCFEISGKPANLQKLVDIHDACVKAQRNLSEPPTDLVRLVFPEWTGYLWQAGQSAMLVRRTRGAGGLDVLAVDLDADSWTRLITGGLTQEVIRLPKLNVE